MCYQLKPWVRVTAFAICGLALVGCAALSEEECLYIDWHAKGLMDGSKGQPTAAVDEYQKTCDRYDVAVDRTAYEQGRLKGAESYCTKDNGYAEGRRGKQYQYACPQTHEQAFLLGYQPGRDLYVATFNVFQNEAKILSETSTISRIEKQIDSTERKLQDSDTPDSERNRIRLQIRMMDSEIDQARQRRYEAESRRDDLNQKCYEVRIRVAQLGFDTSLSCDD